MKLFARTLFAALLAFACEGTSLAYDFTNENGGKTIYYNITSETTCEVTHCATTNEDGIFENNYSGDITVPDNVTNAGRTYTVTAIGYAAFALCPELTAVTVPATVSSIGNSAFVNCTSLSTINIPATISTIDIGAFTGCTALPTEDGIRYAGPFLIEAVDKERESYTIKEGTKFIGPGAFDQCTKMSKIHLSNTLTTIYNGAFTDCKSLVHIEIPNSITYIGPWTFYMCDNLKTVSLPKALTVLENDLFSHCEKLSAIQIPPTVTTIKSHAFSNCGLTEVEIPASVTTIESRAFIGCYYLKTLNIPPYVSEIGEGTFIGCMNISEIHAAPTVPPLCGKEAFDRHLDKAACRLYVPEQALDDYKGADEWKDFFILPTDIPDAIKPAQPAGNGNLQVYDMNGRLVMTTGNEADTNALKGTYIIRQGGMATKRMY